MEFAASTTEETTQPASNEPLHEEDQEVQQRSDSLTSSLSSLGISIKQLLDAMISKASQLSKLTKLIYVTVVFIVAIFTLIYNLIQKNNQFIIKEYQINGTN
jgi:hypothetical protein